MLLRRALIVATALAVLTGAPVSGGAATAAPQITDTAGDANGLNMQDATTGDTHGVVTPKQLDQLDILSVKFVTSFFGSGKKKRAVSLDVTLTLAADPIADNTLSRRYAVRFARPGCARSTAQWDVTRDPNPAIPNSIPDNRGTLLLPGAFFIDGCSNNLFHIAASFVKGNAITFRVPLTMVGKVGTVLAELEAGTNIRARDRDNVPKIDVAAGPVTSYKIGT